MARKQEVMIVLKSGERVYVRCDDFMLTHRNGEMASYKVEGMDPKRKMLWLNIAEVVFVKRVR